MGGELSRCYRRQGGRYAVFSTRGARPNVHARSALIVDLCGSRDTASEPRRCYCFVEGWWEISNEKNDRGCDALSGADFFGSDGPRTDRRRRVGGIIRCPCARAGWCRGRSHCRLYGGTINRERLGRKTIKLSPAAGGARSKCKIYAAWRGLCGNAGNSSPAICSSKRIRSTTRPAVGVRRGGEPSRRSVAGR